MCFRLRHSVQWVVLKLSFPLSQLFVKTTLNVLLGRFGGHVGGAMSGGGGQNEDNKDRKQSSRLSKWRPANNRRCFLIASATSIRSNFECRSPGMLARLAKQVISRHARNYATVVRNDPSKVRNIALVAHIGMTHSWLFRFPKSDNVHVQIPGRQP